MTNKTIEEFAIATFRTPSGSHHGTIYDFVTGNFPYAFMIQGDCEGFHNSFRARSRRVLEFHLKGRLGEDIIVEDK